MMTINALFFLLISPSQPANMPLLSNIPLQRLLIASGAVLGLYWVTLFVMTHLPPEILFNHFSAADKYLDEGGDKTMHLLAYAGLAFLFASWLWIRRVEDRRLWKITGVVLCSYAILDELLQIPFRRTADLGDCIADWAGVVLGSLCFLVVRLLLERLKFGQIPASIETP